MSDDPVIRFTESEDDVRAAWGGLFVDLLRRTLVYDAAAKCFLIDEKPHRVVSMDSKWLRLARVGQSGRDVEVLLPVGHGMAIELRDGVMRLFETRGRPSQSSVRQVTL